MFSNFCYFYLIRISAGGEKHFMFNEGRGSLRAQKFNVNFLKMNQKMNEKTGIMTEKSVESALNEY